MNRIRMMNRQERVRFKEPAIIYGKMAPESIPFQSLECNPRFLRVSHQFSAVSKCHSEMSHPPPVLVPANLLQLASV